MEFSDKILKRLVDLEEKYTALGQDMESYLDGLLYADFLTYWDYIHLDTLLSLQTPRTPIPDEEIFIIYHQVTELYFKLILKAIDQLIYAKSITLELFKRQIKRVNSYFDALVNSFEIMVDGMDKEEFLKFRMSLLPASGFQSAQYRQIEIMSTDFENLLHFSKRQNDDSEMPMIERYPNLYWKFGATELATGRKTLTLRQFERKYSNEFVRLAQRMKDKNLWRTYNRLSKEDQEDVELVNLLKAHDLNANVNWPLMHYRSAARYLQRQPSDIAATGGTNWQEYLPPKNQRIIFYPNLWTEEELENWGKGFGGKFK